MGMTTVYSPDGKPLNFPDYMTEEQIAEVMRQQFPAATPPSTAPSEPPEGFTVVDRFDDGTYVAKFDATGEETYVSKGGSTNDPETIFMMRQNKGNVGESDAGSVFALNAAKDIIGESGTRHMSAMKAAPFLRGYVEQQAAAGAQARAAERGDDLPVGAVVPTENLVRQAIAARELAAPKTVAASRLATGITSGALALPALPATSLLGTMAAGTAIGVPAAIAEGYIAGYGEGGQEEAKAQATTGGAAALGFGLGGPIVGRAAGALGTRYLSKPVRNIMEQLGFKDDAAEVVKDVLALDSADAVSNAATAGPYGSIASVGGATEALLDTVANSPEGRKIVVDNLNETANVASKDLVGSFDSVLGVTAKDLKGQTQDIMADTAEQRSALYGAAYDFEIDAGTDAGQSLMSIFGRVLPEDLRGAQKYMFQEGQPSQFFSPTKLDADTFNELPASQRSKLNVRSNPDGTYTVQEVPTVASIDYLSRQLYGQSEELARAGNTIQSRTKRSLAMQLRKALDEVNPDYAAARASGKDAIDQRAAASLGDDILKPNVTRAEIEREVVEMDDVAKEQLRRALRNRLDEIQANARVNPTTRNDAEVVEALAALKALNTRAVEQKLRLALGDKAADRLSQQIRDTSAALMQRASVATNSKTAIRGLVMERMRELVGENLGEQVSRQGLLPTVSGAVVNQLVSGPSQRQRLDAVAREIAPVLTQRQTPEMLMQSARQMEQLAPQIGRARRGGELIGNAAQRTMLGAGQAQAQTGEEGRVRELLRRFGISQ